MVFRTIMVSAVAAFAVVACSSEPKVPPVNPEDLLNAPMTEIMAALNDGAVTSEALVAAYLERIEALEAGYELNAILTLNPEVMDMARAVDARRAAGEDVGPLGGVPILVKDNIETADTMPTTAGSLALVENFAVEDAPLIAELRSSGALILGKTNLSEWANFRANNSQSGWSGVGGRAKNPHALDRQTCGSSAGSGSSIAAAMGAAAIGTETNGSIICPSNANGIVGFKPTVGIVDQHGIVPISFSQDTAGPMTRTVKDAATMLTYMATDGSGTDYAATLSDTSLAGKRVGVLRFSVNTQPGLAQAFDTALAVLEAEGAELVEIPAFNIGTENYGDKSFLVLLAEFKTTLNEYLMHTPPSVTTRTLADLIEFNAANSEAELSIFGQDIFVQSEATIGIGEPGYQEAVADIQQATGPGGIDRLLAEYEVDILVSPSGPIMPVVNENGPDNWPRWAGAGYLAAVAGYPHLTVPMGFVDGVPLGLSFMSTAGKDAEVLSYGYDYEQASMMRRDPALSMATSED